MPPTRRPLSRPSCALLLLLSSCAFAHVTAPPAAASPPRAEDVEYTGKFEPELVANREDLDQITFRPVRDLSKIKFERPPEDGAELTAGRIHHPPQDKSSILAVLVESDDATPALYADMNLDGLLSASERFELERGAGDNPYVWETTLKVAAPGTPFAHVPVFVQYLKGVRWDEMQDGERWVHQSKTAYARGFVDIGGRRTLVQYGYNPKSKKITPVNGRVGIDGDGDGEIDMDRFSPEAAEARDETVVFRVGDAYVSTKKADVEKNLIVLRAHQASDYKRVELKVGQELPDFQFTDWNGKKRKLSEFRGKYVLLDFWGMWCPACRTELPYLKAAYSRFQPRGLEILGMNTDDPVTVSQIKGQMEKQGFAWTQAKRESILDVIKNYRIHLYPSTLLLGPDGKVISLNQTSKGQPELRGRDLLKSLDQLLPP